MTTRVLVTGGAGYLGSILCEHLLDAGYGVSILDNLMYGQHSLFHLCANPRLEFTPGDARDLALVGRLMARADVIIPLAALVGAPACDQDPWLAASVNHQAVLGLNELRSPRQLLVMPITNSGYGTKSGEVFCTEDSPLEPISLYGKTKVELERELLSTENVISLRLATVFGMSPRMRIDLLVNHFVYAAVTDGYLVLFEKDFKRNFIHIRDVADAFLHAITHSGTMAGRAFNAGLDSANFSKEQLAQVIQRQIPELVIQSSELRSDPDKRNYIVSNERLRAAGFAATRSLDLGVSELIKGYQMLGRPAMKNVAQRYAGAALSAPPQRVVYPSCDRERSAANDAPAL